MAENSTETTERDKSLQESDSLSVEQQHAIALLLVGAPDRVVAEKIGRHRVTVTRWRLYDPAFRAELDRRRTELWGNTLDGLRALLPEALGALSHELRKSPKSGRLALDFLARAGLMGKPYSGTLGLTSRGEPEPADAHQAAPPS